MVLAAGSLDLAFEQTIVSPALPEIERRYVSSPTATAWLVTGFLVAAAVATPLAARLGDQYGRRRALLASLAIFALGSIVCLVGNSIALLIVGRVVQGLGSGVAALALALAREQVDRSKVPVVVAIMVSVGGAGVVVALLIVGPLTSDGSYKGVFWVLLGLAVLLMALVGWGVEESSERIGRKLDLLGAMLITGAVALFMVAVSDANRWGWGSVRVIGMSIGSVVVGGAFVWREFTAPEPLVDPRVLRRRPVWGANAVIVALGFSAYIAFTLAPLIAGYPKLTGYGLGLSTGTIGLILIPVSVGTLVGALIGARLIPRTGARPQVGFAAGGAVISFVLLAVLHRSEAVLAFAPLPLGIGTGVMLGATRDLLILASEPAEVASVLGIGALLGSLASGLGGQVASALVTDAPGGKFELPANAGFTHAFVLAAIMSGVAVISLVALPSLRSDPVVDGAAD